MSLKVVLIDDEYLAVKVLETYVNGDPTLSLLASFTDPQKGLDFVNTADVDLLFLDIQMPGLSGIDLVERLTQDVMVVFTTARSDYAVKAFELNVLDYLVKPVSPARFDSVIEKATDMFRFLKLKRSNNYTTDFIMIRADHRMHKILVSDIVEIEGLSEYLKVHTRQATYITLMTLASLADTLDPNNFVRVHKSHIIHMPSVVSVTANSATLENGKNIPVGRTFKQAFKEATKRFGF